MLIERDPSFLEEIISFRLDDFLLQISSSNIVVAGRRVVSKLPIYADLNEGFIYCRSCKISGNKKPWGHVRLLIKLNVL